MYHMAIRRGRLPRRCLATAALSLALVLFFFASSRAEEVHQVQVEIGSESQREDGNATAKERALSRAVLQEARRILPGSISEGRAEVVRGFLLDRVGDFVLTYSEQHYVQEGETKRLSLEVSVSTEAVKECLKKWGTYYTSRREWAYHLEIPGELGQEKELQLADLEAMSGLRRDRDAEEPLLRIQSPKEGHWRAMFKQQGEKTVYVADSLKELWQKVWSEYFSLREVRLRVERLMRLRVSGWSTSTGLRQFHARLQEWAKDLDRAVLLSVSLTPGEINGSWRVYTLTPLSLEKRLQGFSAQRGLDFTLEGKNASLPDTAKQAEQSPILAEREQ